MKKIGIVLLLLIINTSCIREGSDCHKDLFIKNSSTEYIYLYITDNRISGEDCILFSSSGFEPNELKTALLTNNNCLETRINNVFNGAIIIYVFNEDPNINECELLPSNSEIIFTKEYTVEDLNLIDWTITYSD